MYIFNPLNELYPTEALSKSLAKNFKIIFSPETNGRDINCVDMGILELQEKNWTQGINVCGETIVTN